MVSPDGLCRAFTEHYGHTYFCQLTDGHVERHRGVGQNPGTYSKGSGVLFWSDGDPNSNGRFRAPALDTTATPYTGHDPLAVTGDG